MEIFAGVVILVVLGLALVAIVESRNRSSSINEAYAQLARQFKGTWTPGHLFRGPSACFEHRRAHVLVDTFSKAGEEYSYFTQVQIAWPDPQLRCEIYPATFLSRVGMLLGMKNIRLGSPEFDRAFQISGNAPEAIRRLLLPAALLAIQELGELLGNDEIYVRFSGGTLLVKKSGLIRDYHLLGRLTSLALELYDQALLARSAEIEFVSSMKTSTSMPICQVCGEEILDRSVLCRSCKTLHHRDCWEYAGACSTYGCGQKKFVTLRSKP